MKNEPLKIKRRGELINIILSHGVQNLELE